VDESLLGSPISEGVSLGIHESQSRFWENIIGRNRQFSEAIFPILKDNLGFLSGYTHQDVYYYFNTVRPSLIRVEADEVTYNFHVLLRYQLEKELIAGNIKVSDLPELWNSSMEKYFGITPKNYSEGVLQDIHWSQGSIGYFPTYTLGTVISAQLLYHIIRDIPDFNDLVYSMNFTPIKEWLKNKIHKWGSTYQPQELLKKNIGEEMNPQYFTRYLEEKYLKGN
jgi:carboxypeptidase Taq